MNLMVVAAGLTVTAYGTAVAFPAGGSTAIDSTTIERQNGALLLKTGFCPQDGRPCPDDVPPIYTKPAVRPPEWGPDRTAHAVPAVPPPSGACEEERPPHHIYAATQPRYEGPVYDDWCGIRCWYHILRAGYCGRGCDYYRFRMFEFPEGPLSRYHTKVACRTGP